MTYGELKEKVKQQEKYITNLIENRIKLIQQINLTEISISVASFTERLRYLFTGKLTSYKLKDNFYQEDNEK